MALRPTYWEWRAKLEAECALWRSLTLAMVGVCVLLVGLVVWTATRPTPVYYLISGTRDHR